MKKSRILFASRALESPPQEGGFVLLKDIATHLDDDSIEIHMFSKGSGTKTILGEKIFSEIGWNRTIKRQFFWGLFRTSHKYHLLHMAHIPTSQNGALVKLALRKAKRSGLKTIQTITGLAPMSDDQLKRVLWGDHIVCQSPSARSRISSLTDGPVSLVLPWPSPDRVAYSKSRRDQTRKSLSNNYSFTNLVVFPGEFERMGIGDDFSDCIDTVLDQQPDTLFILACRFDRLGVGERLMKLYPNNVISVGKTNTIIEFMEAADLVIFPTKKMDSKFHPPLIITEALMLGTPVLVSELIDIAIDNRIALSKSSASNWKTFGTDIITLLKAQSKRKIPDDHFQNMIDSYTAIYLETLQS